MTRAGCRSRGNGLRSTQELELRLEADRLLELRRPEELAWLEGAYWRFLVRRFAGLVRTVEAGGARSIVLFLPRLVLLRFRRPNFDTAPGLIRVTWPIEDGALVGPNGRGRGSLRLEVRSTEEPGNALLRTEVAGYRPRLADPRLGRPGALVYPRTQLRLHESTMKAFLRGLATELSRRGRR